LAVLDKSTPNPLIKENDEEGEKKADEKAKEDEAKDKDKDKDKDTNKDKDKKAEKPKPTIIDVEGISGRVLALPIPAGNLSNLAAGEEGKIYYVRRVGMVPGKSGEAFAGTPALVRFDLKTREEETLAEKVDEFRISADRKKLLYRSKESWGIVDA